jgi:hypothetical protein
MPAPTDTKTGCYVYGIVPWDVELTGDARGIKNREIKLVRSDELAAMVSDIDISGPLGTPEDLQAHEEILDSTATAAPVLPLRFAAVLTDEDAVVAELLRPHRDEFVQALQELDGRVQYLVRGRYAEDALLEEILSDNREAAELREAIRGSDPDATREQRIRLGEIVSNAIEAKREEDTRTLLAAVEGHCVALSVREPTHELDAANVACLTETGEEDGLQRAVAELGENWDGRVELRVRGPMAPWDFVGTSAGQATRA